MPGLPCGDGYCDRAARSPASSVPREADVSAGHLYRMLVSPELSARTATLFATGKHATRTAALEEAMAQLARESASRGRADRERPAATEERAE